MLIAYTLLPTVLVGLAAFALTSWRIPTGVQLDLVVDRMSFTLAGDEAIRHSQKGARFRSLRNREFRPRYPYAKRASDQGSNWKRRGALLQPVRVASLDAAAIVLTAAADAQPLLTVDGAARGELPLHASNPFPPIGCEGYGRHTLGESRGFTLRMDGQVLVTNVLSAEPLCDFSG